MPLITTRRSSPPRRALLPALATLLGLAIAALIPATSLEAQSPRGGGFAALVNGRPITELEVHKAVEREIIRLGQTYPRDQLERARGQIREKVMQDLITERLILARCDAENITVRPERVDEEIQRQILVAREQGDSSIRDAADFFEQWETEYGQNEELARREILKQLRIRDLISTIYVEEYISPAELRAYYRNHEDEFSTPAVYAFRQILLPQSDPEVEEKLKAIAAALDAGTSFGTLAEEYSVGPRADLEGLWEQTEQQLDGLLAPVPQMVRETPIGTVSEPFASAKFIHVILVEEKRVGTRKAFDECQVEIRARLRELRQMQQQERFQRELRRDADIRVFGGGRSNAG